MSTFKTGDLVRVKPGMDKSTVDSGFDLDAQAVYTVKDARPGAIALQESAWSGFQAHRFELAEPKPEAGVIGYRYQYKSAVDSPFVGRPWSWDTELYSTLSEALDDATDNLPPGYQIRIIRQVASFETYVIQPKKVVLV